jgi:hypothetical protein
MKWLHFTPWGHAKTRRRQPTTNRRREIQRRLRPIQEWRSLWGAWRGPQPKEVAIVKPVKGRKRRHRGRKPAAGRREEPKELTWSDCGPRKKLAATCRKASSCTTVARHKRKLFKKIRTLGNCGPRSKLTTARIKMTRHARVAWRRENFVRKDWTRNQAEQETPKRREETVERPGTQQWHKGPRPKTAATQENGNIGPRHKMATAS